jgi:hypothetical protein
VESGISARLSRAELRKFGLLVGGVFVALAVILRWRGGELGPAVAGTLGVLLVLGGAFVPGHLAPAYRAWMQLAILLSKVTTPVFLGVVYFVVITPVGLARRLFGRNPLAHVSADGGFWKFRGPGERRSSLERQF